MLESVYLVTMIVGGGFVLVSSFLGGGDGDVEGDAGDGFDPELDDSGGQVGAGGPNDLTTSTGHDLDTQRGGSFRPLASFKFWTFFAAFFGLTGFVFTKLAINTWATLACALAMGLGFGGLVSWALHRLSFGQTSSHASVDRMIGVDAEVLVAIRGETPGKIRVFHGDRPLEYLAVSEAGQRLERGEKVLVVAVEGLKMRVVPANTLFRGE